MATIFGHLNIADTDRVFSSTVGQQVIWTAVQDFIAKYNAQLAAVQALFIESSTSDFKRRYKLPGGGTLQRRGPDGRYAADKRVGQWDVAFPLEDFGRALAINDVAMAYMSALELSNHINTVLIQNTNTVRFETLKALLNSAQRSFVDDLHGTLLVEPLANGDAVVYPPVEGSETEATDNHYLESGYAAASISDANDPYVTIRNELEEHFGVVTGASNIAVFINNAQTAKTQALTDFDEVPDRYIRVGSDVDVPIGLPNVPGKVLGRVDGCWAIEWRWIPANYMLGIHLDAPKPLLKRVDPADTGLGEDLQLVARQEQFPFEETFWRHRFGIGAGNRLNGVVMELGTGGTYSVPTAYA